MRNRCLDRPVELACTRIHSRPKGFESVFISVNQGRERVRLCALLRCETGPVHLKTEPISYLTKPKIFRILFADYILTVKRGAQHPTQFDVIRRDYNLSRFAGVSEACHPRGEQSEPKGRRRNPERSEGSLEDRIKGAQHPTQFEVIRGDYNYRGIYVAFIQVGGASSRCCSDPANRGEGSNSSKLL